MGLRVYGGIGGGVIMALSIKLMSKNQPFNSYSISLFSLSLLPFQPFPPFTPLTRSFYVPSPSPLSSQAYPSLHLLPSSFFLPIPFLAIPECLSITLLSFLFPMVGKGRVEIGGWGVICCR